MESSVALCKSVWCDSFSVLMSALQLGQFVPQHVEMATDRNVQGVSPWLLFFNSLYTFLAAIDLILTRSLPSNLGHYGTFIAAQPHVQMVGSAILSFGMWYWYLRYNKPSPTSSSSSSSAWPIFLTLVACLCATGVTAVLLEGPVATSFAHTCGELAAPLNALMWLPQVLLTLRFHHKGALSTAWVLASFAMDVVYSAYLIALGMHWSVWINNVPDAIFTAALLAIVVRYNAIDRASGRDAFGLPLPLSNDDEDVENNNVSVSVHTPLVRKKRMDDTYTTNVSLSKQQSVISMVSSDSLADPTYTMHNKAHSYGSQAIVISR